jgi:hypothetical protein
MAWPSPRGRLVNTVLACRAGNRTPVGNHERCGFKMERAATRRRGKPVLETWTKTLMKIKQQSTTDYRQQEPNTSYRVESNKIEKKLIVAPSPDDR